MGQRRGGQAVCRRVAPCCCQGSETAPCMDPVKVQKILGKASVSHSLWFRTTLPPWVFWPPQHPQLRLLQPLPHQLFLLLPFILASANPAAFAFAAAVPASMSAASSGQRWRCSEEHSLVPVRLINVPGLVYS